MPTILKNIIIKILRRPASRFLSELQLSESTAPADPLLLFKDWFDFATKIDPDFANALTLSTATSAAVPSNRIVLLKDYDEMGFVFYTNYGSRKATELEENPRASMVFWWKEIYRQVRIEGITERVSQAESENYFASRPRGSKIGAWASRQSSAIASRHELVNKVKELQDKYKESEVPLPPFWGGYRLTPLVIEFWQGKDDRLHDRLRYRKTVNDPALSNSNETWIRERLSP
nr:pyridoxamine 5'-phosphate oxidase [Desulfobulbaceae bacterium]